MVRSYNNASRIFIAKGSNKGNAWLSPRDGQWDAHMVSYTLYPIEMGDEWWFYHGGAANHHDADLYGFRFDPAP